MEDEDGAAWKRGIAAKKSMRLSEKPELLRNSAAKNENYGRLNRKTITAARSGITLYLVHA